MPSINPKLLEAIARQSQLQRAQVYARINKVASELLLPRHLAAIKLAADLGITINRFATKEELGELRVAGSPASAPAVISPMTAEMAARRTIRKPSVAKQIPNQVFVVHGRDNIARESVFSFLRSVGVKPIEWTAAIKMTKKASPYIGEILAAAFENARAVIVILTPDDLAVLREDLLAASDPPYEKRPTGQARPNVLFECGMAFASHPDRTVLLQIGNVRPFSDTAGRHILHMRNTSEKRLEFATKLENAGCSVDRTGTDWLSAGDFTDPEQRVPHPSKARRR
ncbi:MAG: nucleotide-binding protein [Tepidisphaeraceae bacterium]